MTNQELIKPIEIFWRVSKCCYCRKQLTSTDFQEKNHHLFKYVLSSEILVMLFHKKCFGEFDQGTKKAWEQIKNDPIYQWSASMKKSTERVLKGYNLWPKPTK